MLFLLIMGKLAIRLFIFRLFFAATRKLLLINQCYRPTYSTCSRRRNFVAAPPRLDDE